MQNNNTQGSLSDRFRDFGAAPSAELWDTIANQLDEKKKRRFVFWWWTSGIAAVLTLSFAIWHSFADGTGTQHNQSISAIQRTNQQSPNHSIASSSPSEKKINQPIIPHTKQSIESPFLHSFSSNNKQFSAEKEPEWNPNSKDLSIQQPMEERSTNQPIDPEKDSTLTTITEESTSSETVLIVDSSPTAFTEINKRYLPQPAKWRIGLSGTWINGSARTFGPLIPPTIVVEPGTFDAYSIFDSTNYLVNTHYQTGIQLNLAHRLTRKLWIDGGISCGIFGSKQVDLGASFYSTKVTTWKLDIPIGLQYDLINYGRFHLTTGIGINSTIPFYKKISYSPTPTNADNAISVSSVQNQNVVTIEETQRSVEVTTGFQFNVALEYQLSSKLFIQAKPIVRYYPFSNFVGDSRTSPLLKNTWWWGGNVGLFWEF